MAENSEGRKKSNSINLKIKYKPVVSIRMGSNPEDIREGDDVSFECHTSAYPITHKTSWFYNDVEIYDNINEGIALRGRKLTLMNITRTMVGQLTCISTNELGSGVSEPVTLNVKYAPICTDDKEALVVISSVHEISLKCRVHSNPPAASFHWVFDNSKYLTDIPETNLTNSFGYISTSQLNYSLVSPLDFGKLLCLAQNEVGRQHDPCVYRILKEGPPLPLLNCAITDKRTDYVQIICKENFNGGSPQKFHVEVMELPSQKLKLTKTLNKGPPIFNIKDLSVVKTYRFNLYAINRQGRSAAVVFDKITTNGISKPDSTNFSKPSSSSSDSLIEVFSKFQEVDSLFRGELLKEMKGLTTALEEIRKELQILNDMNKIRARIEYQDAIAEHGNFDLHIEF